MFLNKNQCEKQFLWQLHPFQKKLSIIPQGGFLQVTSLYERLMDI